QLVDVVPFGDQQPLWRGSFDPFNVRAAHKVGAPCGFDCRVDLWRPLFVVKVLVGHVDFGDVICRRLGLRVNALDRQAADTDARERGQRHCVACFHEIDPRCRGRTFDRETSLKYLFWEAIWAAIDSPALSFDHLVGARPRDLQSIATRAYGNPAFARPSTM